MDSKCDKCAMQCSVSRKDESLFDTEECPFFVTEDENKVFDNSGNCPETFSVDCEECRNCVYCLECRDTDGED